MSIRLIKGDDPSLVSQAVSSAVDELVGNGDRSLMVEEVTDVHYVGPEKGPAEITPLVVAAHSPPFLTERRVVVGRHLGRFTKKEDVTSLVNWLENPLPSTDLILVWEKWPDPNVRSGAIPKALKDAIKAAGGIEIDAAPKGKGRQMLLESKLADAPVRFDNAARRAIADRLGDDVGRLQSIIDVLTSTFGEGAAMTADMVEPFLGEAADVPPWDLTDALDRGDIATSIDMMHRMTRGGDRHALALMATLHNHYQRALALDGAPVAGEKDAAALLGIKGSTFPAKKALTLSRKLGSDRLREIIDLLATADLDLRGNSAIPAEALLEVLIARLARISR